MENQSVASSPENNPVNPAPISQPSTPIQSKTSLFVPVLLTILISAVVFGLGGYYLGTRTTIQQQLVNQDQQAPNSQTPNVTSSPSVSLKKYTSSFEKLSFQYPSDWKLSPTQPQSNFPEGDAIGLQDPNGKVVVNWISAIDGLGGSCDPNAAFGTEGEMGAACPLYEVVDKEKLSNVDLYYVAYVVTRDGVKYEPTFALQSQDGLLMTKRAMGYLLFFGRNNGKVLAGLSGRGLTTGTKTEAQNFFTTPEAAQAKNVLLSATY